MRYGSWESNLFGDGNIWTSLSKPKRLQKKTGINKINIELGPDGILAVKKSRFKTVNIRSKWVKLMTES